MTIAEVEQYLSANVSCFPADAVEQLRELLLSAPDDRTERIMELKLKKPNVTLLLSFVLGFWGADQFYLGRPLYGILKLLTCGLGGWLYAVGILMATRSSRNINFRNILKAVS